MFAGFYGIYLGIISTNYLWIALAAYFIVGMLGTTIGLHRYFSHRSFETNKFWHYIMGFCATISTVGTILGWVGLHRYHHGHSDKENDPHNPHEIGILKAWFYLWKPSKFGVKTIRRELKDPMISFLHRHYFKTIFAYMAVLALIDPWLIIWCYCLPANGSYLAISAVTVLGHMTGYRNYEVKDTAKNSYLTWLLSYGEGFHNNHHARPNDWNQGHKWWEIDPNAWIIKLIKTN